MSPLLTSFAFKIGPVRRALKRALHAGAALAGAALLAGCLMTERPAFGPGNSVRLGDSAEFAEFAQVLEAFAGEKIGEDDEISPDMRVVERDDFLILENIEEGSGRAWYVAVGHAGGRPFSCHVSPDAQTDEIAAGFGLTVTYERHFETAGTEGQPVDPEHSQRIYHGTDAALLAFVLDQFDRRTLNCEFPAPDD